MNLNPLEPHYPSKLMFAEYRKRRQSKSQSKPTGKKTNLPDAKMYCNGVYEPLTSELSMFFSRSGSVIISNDSLVLHGECVVIYPQGIIFNTNYKQGELTGWTITYCEEKFILATNYRRGIQHGVLYNYNIALEFMSRSVYNEGKLVSIQAGRSLTYKDFLKELKFTGIVERVEAIVNKRVFLRCKPSLQSESTVYYGSFNHKNGVPEEFGVLLTKDQLFYGFFKQGLLHGMGTITFGQNMSYFGQFKHGSMTGYGRYTKNGEYTYKHNKDQIDIIQFNRFLDTYYSSKDKYAEGWVRIEEQYQMLKKIYFPEHDQSEIITSQSGQISQQSLPSFDQQRGGRISEDSSSKNMEVKWEDADQHLATKNRGRSNTVANNSPHQIHLINIIEPSSTTKEQENRQKQAKANFSHKFNSPVVTINPTKSYEVTSKKPQQKGKPPTPKKSKMGLLTEFEWQQLVDTQQHENINNEHTILGLHTPEKLPAFKNASLTDKKDSENAHLNTGIFASDIGKSLNESRHAVKEDKIITKLRKMP